MKKLKSIYSVVCSFFCGLVMLSQEVPQQDLSALNDISNVSVAFENAFYSALSYRLIDKHKKGY